MGDGISGNSLVVLAVIPGAPQGNSMIFAKRQVAALDAAGVSCQEFYLTSRTSPISLWNEFKSFRTKASEIKPDLVHAHYGTVTALFCVLAFKGPVVVNFRGSDLLAPDGDWRSRMGRLMSQWAAFKATRIVCVGQNLVDSLWWRKDRASVIPSGVNLDFFKPGDRTLARQKLGWDENESVVVFNAGKDPHIKRLDLATAAVQVARKNIGTIKFEILDGDKDPAYLADVYRASDCLLLTSISEGSPNVVKEALASDLPVVSVDVGDVALRLEGVSPSAIVPATAEELGLELSKILAMEGKRSNGRQAVIDLGLDRTVEKLQTVYLQALGS